MSSKEFIQERSAELFKSTRAELSKAINQLTGAEIPAREMPLDYSTVAAMNEKSLYSASKSKFATITSFGDLIMFTKGDLSEQLERAHGTPIDWTKWCEEIIPAALKPVEPDKHQLVTGKLMQLPRAVIKSEVTAELIHTRQRDLMKMRVDMLAEEATIAVEEDFFIYTRPHTPFRATGTPNAEVVEDYKQHFPEIERYLELIVAARFAGDRKKAHLWLQATSDWGKGLLEGALKNLGIVVSMSVEETQAILKGQPVGYQANDFNRCFVIWFDEFETVRRSLKQLQNSITLSPKGLMKAEVEVFLKMFTSADSVGSLVSNEGIEDQFANRFSYINKEGSIEDRALFAEVGKTAYREALECWIADEMNALVEKYRKYDVYEADKYLEVFQKEFGIDQSYARYEDSFEDSVLEFGLWLDLLEKSAEAYEKGVTIESKYAARERFGAKTLNLALDSIIRKGEKRYLFNANKLYQIWVDERATHSNKASLSKAAEKMLKKLAIDGNVSAQIRPFEGARSRVQRRGMEIELRYSEEEPDNPFKPERTDGSDGFVGLQLPQFKTG